MAPLGQSRNGELYHEPKDETKSQIMQEFKLYLGRTSSAWRFMIEPIQPRIAAHGFPLLHIAHKLKK